MAKSVEKNEVVSIELPAPSGWSKKFFGSEVEFFGFEELSCLDSGVGVRYGCGSRGRILHDLTFKIRGTYPVAALRIIQGPSGAGGIIRNEHGQIISAFVMPLETMSNNMVEAMALKSGIDWCVSKGIKNIVMECHSKLPTD
ncbi:hypothetical protein MTR67_053538 [Solanum verrucosum]|uniref:RNase H type-1 domain-containing protein n=1 Tax=Solanum verrucosum TaxID=315347 RepID=A0AAF1A3R2_SOLVR|nr:hypothetical protein MTR67_053538 [Solanum verrucosum]